MNVFKIRRAATVAWWETQMRRPYFDPAKDFPWLLRDLKLAAGLPR